MSIPSPLMKALCYIPTPPPFKRRTQLSQPASSSSSFSAHFKRWTQPSSPSSSSSSPEITSVSQECFSLGGGRWKGSPFSQNQTRLPPRHPRPIFIFLLPPIPPVLPGRRPQNPPCQRKTAWTAMPLEINLICSSPGSIVSCPIRTVIVREEKEKQTDKQQREEEEEPPTPFCLLQNYFGRLFRIIKSQFRPNLRSIHTGICIYFICVFWPVYHVDFHGLPHSMKPSRTPPHPV